MRYTGPKARACRRHRANLFGTSKYTKILERKMGKPGIHGQRAPFGKLSEYGMQLNEKQKARMLFGISEKQFRNYFRKASKMAGETGENLLRLLELRLDNVIYVSQFAVTRMQARQMVTHGHFRLNGRRVDIPSILVRPGDKIELIEKMKDSPLYSGLDKLKDYSPKWLNVNLKNVAVDVFSFPERDDLEKSIDSQLIVEFYSR